MKRREFLRRGLLAGSAFAAGMQRPSYTLQAAPVRRFANDVVYLGPDKIKLSRLAMGTGTSGFRGASNQTRQLGVKGITDLFLYGYDNGLFFWDSADAYGSHPHLKAALEHIAREKVTIMSKSTSKDAAGMRKDIERFRKEIGTDYIDILLLHAVREADWPEQRKGAMDVIEEYKEKGVIRTRGISCHSLAALKQVPKQSRIDVDLARINPIGALMDADPATVIDVLREIKGAGKGVIGMKILGEGRMRNRVDEALAHVLALDCVDCFTIGAESVNELSDLIRRMPEASQRGWPAHSA
jgi:predicted aldo/keto reductase-like oxidoreductase